MSYSQKILSHGGLELGLTLEICCGANVIICDSRPWWTVKLSMEKNQN